MYRELAISYKRLNDLLPEAGIDFLDFNSLEDIRPNNRFDPTHSTNKSAVVIAETYADHIIKILNQR